MSDTSHSHDATLQLSLLYELALAIGHSLDLKTNCEMFLETLLKVKPLSYAAVWLAASRLSGPESVSASDSDAYVLVCGLPPAGIRDRILPRTHIVPRRLAQTSHYSVSAADPQFSDYITETGISGGTYAVFSLGGLGFLKVYTPARETVFSSLELNPLRAVLAKFTVSLEGCIAYQALIGEIAERKHILQALQQSEMRYRTVVESASDAIVVIRDGLVAFVNRRAAELAEEQPEHLIGQPFVRYLHPAEAARVMEYHRRRLAGGRPAPIFYETRLQSPRTGRVVTVEITANLIQYEERPAVLVQIRDITERRRIEAERARLALALEQTADAVMIADPRGCITYINPSFEGLWGAPRAALLGREASFIAFGDARAYHEMLRNMASGQVWRGRLRGRRHDGETVVCDTIATPTRDEHGNIVAFVCVQRDITKELQLEEQYLQAQKMDSIGRLAGGIAHDFNNIMTAILGFGTMILEQVGDNHVLRHAVEQIVTAGERATNLTRQLLTFSRRHITEVRTLDLNAVITEMLTLLRRALGEDVELVTQLDDEAGCIRADPGLIQQVVMNLAINARDAMPRGGRLILRTQVARLSEEFCRSRFRLKPGDYVLFSVIDAGEGMTPEVLSHAFEPFFTTKPKGKGSGLGLATVYAIVQQCHGHIEIESEVGRGTTVKIWFPRLETGSDAVPVEIEDEAQQGTETILVVEDEDLVRDLTARILRSLGYSVLEATNGKEGLAIVEKLHGRVDLVLTDVIMPQMGGQEMAEHLRERYPNIKIVYISGFTEVAITEGGHPVGAERWIPKPYTREILARRIREVLDRNASGGEPVSRPTQTS